MKRAAVIIGVRKSGQLPVLKAALAGANKMAGWARKHGFDHVVKITDSRHKVRPQAIYDAVEKIVHKDSFEQLFIYFAGHGVNLHYSEYWLLSEAPTNPQAAVNVASSVQLAKRSGIPHVVLVSDACRTAPEGIRAQALRGSEIFPNHGRRGPQQAVDVFYSSLLGHPALEIQDQKTAALRYVSIYTEELLAALKGKRGSILTPDGRNKARLLLRPRPLKRHLTSEVPRLVRARLGTRAAHTQTPDAEILSDEDAFLQEFRVAGTRRSVVRGHSRKLKRSSRGSDAGEPSPRPPSSPIVAVNTAQKVPTLDGDIEIPAPSTTELSGIVERSNVIRLGSALHVANMETPCGFMVRGADIVQATPSRGATVESLTPTFVKVVPGGPVVDVLLELDGKRAVVLPAFAEFFATLTIDKSGLRNVVYEPIAGSQRREEYDGERLEIAMLRGSIATAVRGGRFRLNRKDAPGLIPRIRYKKKLDPSMALYAAYAYHRLGQVKLIRDMRSYLDKDIGASLFDIELLSERKLSSKARPFLPMLAQGWTLLSAFKAWTRVLDDLRPHLITTSLWTLFDEDAIPALRKALVS